MEPLFTNNAIIFGLLAAVLALVFYTEGLKTPFWTKFYRFVPGLLLCYFLPALLNWPLGLIAPEWYDNGLLDALRQLGHNPPTSLSFEKMTGWLEANQIAPDVYEGFKKEAAAYSVATNYFLPASLLLFCLSLDLKGIIGLGPKALIMFLTGTLGVVLGGPIALWTVYNLFPDGFIPADRGEVWKGLSCIAGSWIGGGPNQMALKQIYEVDNTLFGTMVVVDVIVANFWMGFLLYGASITQRIDKWLKADTSGIDALQEKVAAYRASIERVPGTRDMVMIMGVTFAGVALSHWLATNFIDLMNAHKETMVSLRLDALIKPFFWIVLFSTVIGIVLSFTPVKKLEGVGASRWGSVFIYLLVASIGMQMNLLKIAENMGLFAVGIIWMAVHGLVMFGVAKLIRAPFFFLAVGSQANIGGAASAPVVASAFNPALAPVGVLLAVLGYAIGTYGGMFCAGLMRWVAG
ncbi:MAG: DUF819 family protein [Saprospiraceae bacterium]|nr:DUF819 family protein [Saprospiraceae bacterium]